MRTGGELAAACRRAFENAIERGESTVDPADAAAVEALRQRHIEMRETYYYDGGR